MTGAARAGEREPFRSTRQAEFFLAVVDGEGITRAAERLRVAQPSLSQAVRTLERQAGAVLFERTPRGAVPTAAGAALVEPARRLLHRAALAREAVRDVVELREGMLELVAHASVAADPLAEAVGLFRRRHPHVRVRVEDARDDEELVYALTGGRHELAVAYLPLPSSAALVTEELGAHEVWAALPPDSPRAGVPVPLREVARMPLVAVLHGGSSRRAVREALGRSAHPSGAAGARTGRPSDPPWAGVVTPQLGTVVPLVMAGAGAALVDGWHAERISGLGGVVRPLDPPLRSPYGMVHRAAPLSPAPAEFARTLREVCGRPAR